jgi:beta-lysine 5,6-aminomutase beta subunit
MTVDLRRVRPYGDHLDDGIMQMSFTLPVPDGRPARLAALRLAAAMGLAPAIYGTCAHAVDFLEVSREQPDQEYMSEKEVERFVEERIGRPVVIVGASTGTDTHNVGINAVMNVKGFKGHHGLEAYRGFVTYNLGSQVSNRTLVAKAVDVGADAILVSQTVTQQDLHVDNLADLVALVQAEGIRSRVVLACGGPRISDTLAKDLGYDAGFAKGTLPHHVATFIVRELARRTGGGGDGPCRAVPNTTSRVI